MSRLYNVLNKMIVKKKTETLTARTGTGDSSHRLVTSIPLSKPILSAYSSDRDGWLLNPLKSSAYSSTNWVLGANLSGTYTVVIYYLDYDL